MRGLELPDLGLGSGCLFLEYELYVLFVNALEWTNGQKGLAVVPWGFVPPHKTIVPRISSAMAA